ncbi:hypothetical protein MHYP_G00054200 [Metynnis hypsauchen]
MNLSPSLLVLAWRLCSLLPEGSRLKKLCSGAVAWGSLSMVIRSPPPVTFTSHSELIQVPPKGPGRNCSRKVSQK